MLPVRRGLEPFVQAAGSVEPHSSRWGLVDFGSMMQAPDSKIYTLSEDLLVQVLSAYMLNCEANTIASHVG